MFPRSGSRDDRGAGGPATTRRGFLRLAGATAAFTALSQIRALPPAARAAAPAAGGRFFDERRSEILTLVMERIVDDGQDGTPRVRDTGAVATVDALCGRLDPAVSEPLPLALDLFEYGPLIFDLTFTRFSRMSDAQRDASLTAWMTSRLAIRRLAFTGIRNLCLLGYYSQDGTWPAIGYAGPLLRGPARAEASP